jgi:S-DNA-T family DNA segregation ATPase FtsK/SpoIIIE
MHCICLTDGTVPMCCNSGPEAVADGTQTGHALGEEPEIPTSASYGLLEEPRRPPTRHVEVWSEDVAAGLAELRPDVCAGWTPEQWAAAVRSYGIRTVQVRGTTEDGKGANRRGLRRADVLAAIDRRDGRSAAWRGPASTAAGHPPRGS